jgi:hypothetical protein
MLRHRIHLYISKKTDNHENGAFPPRAPEQITVTNDAPSAHNGSDIHLFLGSRYRLTICVNQDAFIPEKF